MKKLLKAILVLGVWLSISIADAQPSPYQDCSILLEQFRTQYEQDESGKLFNLCQACCEATGNDSLLVQILIADSSSRFLNPGFSKILQKAFVKYGGGSYKKILGDSYKSQAFAYSKVFPDSAIYFYSKASTYYRSISDTIGMGITLQNMAFCYEEKKHNVSEALKYSLQAKEVWEASRDSMNAANIYKYIGYLKGKQQDYAEGKMYIHKAEALFNMLGNRRGIAVCYFDLAMLYKEEHRPDSVITFLLKAKNIWKDYGDSSRIFNINNELLQAYRSMKERKKASRIVYENEAMLRNNDAMQVEYKEKFEQLKRVK